MSKTTQVWNTNNFNDNDQSYMNQKRLEQILECKNRFLQNYNDDPRNCPYMNQEVAKSWIRSRNMGVDPYSPMIGQQIDPEEFEEIRTENRVLINITSLLFDTFKDLVSSSSYALYLFDKNCTAILQAGEMMKSPVEYAPIIDTRKKDIDPTDPDVNWHHDLNRLVWKEDNVGTNAHILSMQLKRPLQLVGPEHYSLALHNTIASAAPILDENGEILATLVLGQPFPDYAWDDNIQRLSSHTFGLITTMAAAIETHLKLQDSYEHLEKLEECLKEVNKKLEKTNECLKTSNETLTIAYDTLEATLASIDEGIITIDRTGKIIHINQTGARILKLEPAETKKRNISEFLGSQSRLMNLVKDGKNANNIEESIFTGKEERSYWINIWPVINKKTNQTDTAVLRFIRTERINEIVASRTGAIANYKFKDIIGDSKAIKKAIDEGQRFASSMENILLIGNSGTGKELFAQAIHNHYRPNGPFIAVNCAALPRELIESELFGYEGGSFTGAMRSGRPGKIELADGGTLFLDEIGDMPFEVQSVLLRVLEDKQVMRVGGQRYKKVDFRLIAGTNKDLNKMVKDNLFREDLYYRLSVLSINIPALRDRDADIEILAHYFVNKYCDKIDRRSPKISAATLKIIKEYDWPGNVRQLENAMIYAVNSTQGDSIEPENLPESLFESSYVSMEEIADSAEKLEEALSLNNLEKKAIKKAMMYTRNNVALASDMLGINKSTLYRKLKEYEINF